MSIRVGLSSPLILVDVPCCRCGRTIRGQSRDSQCVECGMENVKSLGIAAYRCEDPGLLERVSRGMDLYAWGTIVALSGSVLVPLFVHGRVSCEAFGVVVAVTLSAISAIGLTAVHGGGRGRVRPINVMAMAIGSGAVVVPAAALRVGPGEHVRMATLTFFILAGLSWFAGECSRVRLLEHHAAGIAGKEIARQARILRRGMYAMFWVIAAGLLLTAFGHVGVRAGMSAASVLAVSVGLLTFTLMGALLHARAAMSIRKEASFARAVRDCMGIVDRHLLPDEPDWDVPDLRRSTI